MFESVEKLFSGIMKGENYCIYKSVMLKMKQCPEHSPLLLKHDRSLTVPSKEYYQQNLTKIYSLSLRSQDRLKTNTCIGDWVGLPAQIVVFCRADGPGSGARYFAELKRPGPSLSRAVEYVHGSEHISVLSNRCPNPGALYWR